MSDNHDQLIAKVADDCHRSSYIEAKADAKKLLLADSAIADPTRRDQQIFNDIKALHNAKVSDDDIRKLGLPVFEAKSVEEVREIEGASAKPGSAPPEAAAKANNSPHGRRINDGEIYVMPNAKGSVDAVQEYHYEDGTQGEARTSIDNTLRINERGKTPKDNVSMTKFADGVVMIFSGDQKEGRVYFPPTEKNIKYSASFSAKSYGQVLANGTPLGAAFDYPQDLHKKYDSEWMAEARKLDPNRPLDRKHKN